jgi:hypothetical protein
MREDDKRVVMGNWMGNRAKSERERESTRGRVNDRPAITNRELISLLRSNNIVVLVTFEIYHRIGLMQTRQHIR